jgi:hypothetical protein
MNPPGESPRAFVALAAVSTLATILAAYQSPTRTLVQVGSIGDTPFVEGFHERETRSGGSSRWSQGRSTIVFPGVEWNRSQELIVRMAARVRPPGAPPPEVTVTANGVFLDRVLVAAKPGNYQLAVPLGVLSPLGDLAVELSVPTFRAGGSDDRNLGVEVQRAELTRAPSPFRPALPPAPTAVGWIANLCLWVVILSQTPFGGRRWRLLTALSCAEGALALALVFARPYASLLAWHALAFGALAYALIWQVPRWSRQARSGQRAPLEFLHTLGVDSPVWRARLEAGIVVLACAHYVFAVLLPLREWGPKDFRIYHVVGSLWREGRDYYDLATMKSRFGDEAAGAAVTFTNPPSGAALYSPFARLPLDEATTLWRVLNVAALAAAGLLLWLWARGSVETPPRPLWLVLLLANSEPLRITLRLGQVGIVVLFLLALCLWGWSRGRAVVAGVSVALAAAVKIIPGFLLLYFLGRRDWRTFGAACTAGGLLLVLFISLGGLAPWRTFFVRVLPAVSAPVSYFGNQSVQAFLGRWAGESPATPPSFNYTFDAPRGPRVVALRTIGLGTALGVTAFAAWWMRRHESHEPLHGTLELATMVPLMLLVAPLVWEFYLAWLIPTIFVLMVVLGDRPVAARGQVAVVAALVVAWVFLQLGTTDLYRTPGWPVPLMSLGLYATVLVLACSLYLLSQTARAPAAGAGTP